VGRLIPVRQHFVDWQPSVGVCAVESLRSSTCGPGCPNPVNALVCLRICVSHHAGQSVASEAASVDELSSGAREASEGLQGAADKMDRQLKSALSSKDPVNAAPTSEDEQVRLSLAPVPHTYKLAYSRGAAFLGSTVGGFSSSKRCIARF